MNPLAPEHLDDLRRSGLTDATIEALRFEAVRPHDIQLKGVESAYQIPYFNLNGSVNCFRRMKLFPPIKTNSGTMRYWQPPDTLPHLYCPPVLNWQSAARDATKPLVITEGEKNRPVRANRVSSRRGSAGSGAGPQPSTTATS